MTGVHLPLAARIALSGVALASAAPALAQHYPAPPRDYDQRYDGPRYDDRRYDARAYDARAYDNRRADPNDPNDDIIVYGRPRPEDADTASQRVSYADLDLSYAEDRRELRRRIGLTARYLCERLGESDGASYGSSCRDEGTRDALRRVGTVEARWAPRGTSWVPAPRWRPDY